MVRQLTSKVGVVSPVILSVVLDPESLVARRSGVPGTATVEVDVEVDVDVVVDVVVDVEDAVEVEVPGPVDVAVEVSVEADPPPVKPIRARGFKPPPPLSPPAAAAATSPREGQATQPVIVEINRIDKNNAATRFISISFPVLLTGSVDLPIPPHRGNTQVRGLKKMPEYIKIPQFFRIHGAMLPLFCVFILSIQQIRHPHPGYSWVTGEESLKEDQGKEVRGKKGLLFIEDYVLFFADGWEERSQRLPLPGHFEPGFDRAYD